MSVYLTVPVGLLCAVLQSSLMPRLQLFGATPNLVLVVLVIWVIQAGSQEGASFALTAGIALDTLSSAPFGTAIIGLVLVTLATGLGAANIFHSAWYLPYAAIAMATLLYGLTQVVALQAAGRSIVLGTAFVHVVLPELVANFVLMIVFYETVRLLQRHRQRAEVR